MILILSWTERPSPTATVISALSTKLVESWTLPALSLETTLVTPFFRGKFYLFILGIAIIIFHGGALNIERSTIDSFGQPAIRVLSPGNINIDSSTIYCKFGDCVSGSACTIIFFCLRINFKFLFQLGHSEIRWFRNLALVPAIIPSTLLDTTWFQMDSMPTLLLVRSLFFLLYY